MKISELFSERRATVSFEVFPPKTGAALESVKKAAYDIAGLKPDFMSVTCGAGGTTDVFTDDIAAGILASTGVPTVAHMTCVAADRKTAAERLEKLERSGVENILALRGDLPEGSEANGERDFAHASDLTAFIKENSDICVGGACYPEKHPEAASLAEDIRNIRLKQEAGCAFLTTQMFFDNNIFYRYLWKLRNGGVTLPVCAGIMPITNAVQVDRAIKLSGCVMPSKFLTIVDRYGKDPDSMRQAGILYAAEQIVDLAANGVEHIHIYSMNKPEVAGKLSELLSFIKN